jgi:hypothetical protein
MKQYVKLFEDFAQTIGSVDPGMSVLPNWAKPNAPVGAIGHAALENSFGEYTDRSQSMTNFSIGDKVRCIDPKAPSYGRVGSIVAFEDVTVRWKIDETDTTVGIDALEYRCHPQMLQKIIVEEVIVVPKNSISNTQVDSGTNQTDAATL